jgi:hypothetical protein
MTEHLTCIGYLKGELEPQGAWRYNAEDWLRKQMGIATLTFYQRQNCNAIPALFIDGYNDDKRRFEENGEKNDMAWASADELKKYGWLFYLPHDEDLWEYPLGDLIVQCSYCAAKDDALVDKKLIPNAPIRFAIREQRRAINREMRGENY